MAFIIGIAMAWELDGYYAVHTSINMSTTMITLRVGWVNKVAFVGTSHKPTTNHARQPPMPRSGSLNMWGSLDQQRQHVSSNGRLSS